MSKMEMEAKKKMLQKLKGDMREKMHKSLPEAFKGKKVIIEADSEEGLEKVILGSILFVFAKSKFKVGPIAG